MQKELINERLNKIQELIRTSNMNGLVIGPSSDFQFIVGYSPRVTERLSAIIIPYEGNCKLLVPQLEAPLYDEYVDYFDLVPWKDGQNPVQIMSAMLKEQGITQVGVNDEFWSAFLFQLQEENPALQCTSSSPILKRLRIIKTEEELDILRTASQKIDEVWAEFCRKAKPIIGKTEIELRNLIIDLMGQHGFTEVAWVDVGSGPNGASPLHHGNESIIKEGDPVVIDFAGKYAGYCADICRVVVAGTPSPEYANIYDIVHEAQEAAFKAIQIGVACEEIDRTARQIITDRGYGDYFLHRVGHGLGIEYHEDPYIVEGNKQLIEQGMVFSNEPGIYIPGRWGVRIEDIIVVTESALNEAKAASPNCSFSQRALA